MHVAARPSAGHRRGQFAAPCAGRSAAYLQAHIAWRVSPPLSTPSVPLAAQVGLAQMLKGGVIMDVVTPEQARIAEEAGESARPRALWPASAEAPLAWCHTPQWGPADQAAAAVLPICLGDPASA